MFIILLQFSANKAAAPELMEAHKAWIGEGFKDGVFLLVGNLLPDRGGCILAHGTSREDLERRVSTDPFVAEKVVSAEIHAISPRRADDRLSFLCT